MWRLYTNSKRLLDLEVLVVCIEHNYILVYIILKFIYLANYNGEYEIKAIKVIKRDLIQNHYQGFLKDIAEQLRGYFKSDNITKVYQIQETVDYLYIVEDFIPFENSLIACLCLRNTYTQYDVVCIICYIISTLIGDNNTGSDYVYVHKNIKPDNIFLMDPDDLRTIMLTDYNISQDYFVYIILYYLYIVIC